MDHLYQLEKLLDNIYMMIIPLPNNPLKELNLYIIKGNEGEKSMIIDTGFNRPESIEAFDMVFEELGLNTDNTDLFLTHLHSDHTGLATHFADQGMTVIASATDARLLNESISKEDPMWVDTVEQGHMQGLGPDQLDIDDHPGYKYRPVGYVDYKIAYPGDIFSIGGYNFKVMDLKGHTPGIIGLYEEDKKILFCGDHILTKITPNITFWGFQYGDSLGTYFESLDRVYDLEVDHLYSSHRALIDDHRERIDQLRAHHAQRLDEARKALEKTGKSTVREVTKQLQWDIRARSWDDFPDSQKWFAAGEAMAHLEHLRARGEADFERDEDGVLHYYLLDD